jgi:hypothetical protein
MSEKLTITKVGGNSQVQLAGKKTRKSVKTFPRGILKVKDPAKAPPLRKTVKQSKIRLVTEAGTKKYRRTIRKKLEKMSNEKVKALAQKHGLLKGSGTPPALIRDIVEGGAIAGFISID